MLIVMLDSLVNLMRNANWYLLLFYDFWVDILGIGRENGSRNDKRFVLYGMLQISS